MAKTQTQPVVETLTLDYQLAELSSSQHRAGLAGLVLVVQWLQDEPDFQEKVTAGAICRITRLDDRGATLEINQAGVAALFDEIYAASTEEQERTQAFKNPRTKEVIPPLREEEREETNAKTGKTKTKKVYIYPVVVPKGSFLAHTNYDASSDGNHGHWIKLWRDLVWSILRGVPATRKPFEARAEGTYSADATTVWQQLVQPETFTVDLPSTYFLGAQANNAENVPFKDRARFQFLLHFWLFAAQIYVPSVVDNEGKRNFVGYAIAIPDIAQLQWFCEELPIILHDRSSELSGYRPRDAIVDLAVESALDLMRRLRDRIRQTAGDQSTADTLFGIDVIHTEKQGNNVRLLSITRLDPDSDTTDRYIQIRDTYWNPLFRRQCLLNLLNHQPWYTGFDALLCTLPYERSIEDKYFRGDVRKKIQSFIEEEKHMAETSQKSTVSDIETLIFELVKTYVRRKLKSKYQLEWKEEWANKEGREKHKGYDEYSEKKSKIAKSAFLEVRSRTEKGDFIRYFTGTLCSVPQYMGSESYVKLAQALYREEEYEKVRTLTLLALSANG